MKSMKLVRIVALSFFPLTVPILLPADSFTSNAQREAVAPELEGTVWAGSDAYLVPYIQETHTMEFVCTFGRPRQVSCDTTVVAAEKTVQKQRYNAATRRDEPYWETVPSKTLLSGPRDGTYERNGNSIRIVVSPEYVIVATIRSNQMVGKISGLEVGITPQWVARRISERSNKGPNANKNVTEDVSNNTTTTASGPRLGSYAADATQTVRVSLATVVDTIPTSRVSVKIRIDTVDRDGNVKGEFIHSALGSGGLTGKLDDSHKLQLKGFLTSRAGDKWEILLTVTVEEKALRKGHYLMHSGNANLEGLFSIAELEEDR
jgi:hypothetical protein